MNSTTPTEAQGRALSDDERAALDFYVHNPSAALFDLRQRFATPTDAARAPAPQDAQWSQMPAGPLKALHQARDALLGPVADGAARRCAIAAIDAVIAAPAPQDAQALRQAENLDWDLAEGECAPLKFAPQASPLQRDFCPEKLKPGGCQLPNVHCGFPDCNKAPTAPLQAEPEASGNAEKHLVACPECDGPVNWRCAACRIKSAGFDRATTATPATEASGNAESDTPDFQPGSPTFDGADAWNAQPVTKWHAALAALETGWPLRRTYAALRAFEESHKAESAAPESGNAERALLDLLRTVLEEVDEPKAYRNAIIDGFSAKLRATTATPAAREAESGEPGEAEKELRRMLCARYSGAMAYMDDGEAQDNREQPLIDFLRDSVAEIKRKMFVRATNAALAASQTQSQAKGDITVESGSYAAVRKGSTVTFYAKGEPVLTLAV